MLNIKKERSFEYSDVASEYNYLDIISNQYNA